MVNQANLEDMPTEKLAEFEAQYKKLDEENKALTAEARSLASGEYMRAVVGRRGRG